ncbi:hypothetical protein NTH_03586 [Nitratireductor thuwali]|uniref:Uncharacterized protein n=2 Tax=Nitratireductor thuwali TaxID=2267699 RepID=A0ABY5MPA2_9HYPH|nr:hypothetical protein NTH_03586 [Nitratireductor thuwali]
MKQAKTLRRFSFTPIYVGADRQFDLLVGSLRDFKQITELVEILGKALLSVRVKFACLDTVKEIVDDRLEDIENLSHQYVRLNKEKEVRICNTLSLSWGLSERAHSFLEVRSLLHKHISKINTIIERVRYNYIKNIEQVVSSEEFITHDPIYSCAAFIDAFNSIAGTDSKVWALCIDELEIMPDPLQKYLFACLRSIDQRIVLKLATSPFSAITWERASVDRPMPGHDFTVINLAYGNKREAKRFTARLLDALLLAEGTRFQAKRPTERGEAVLGESPIREGATLPAGGGPYAPPDGAHYRRFVSLREKDVGFRQFLEDRAIVLEKLHKEPESRRAGQARKYIWQVAIRNEFGPTNVFTRPDQTEARRPPSKKRIPDVYLGYDSLLTICEGNPRTTIGLLRPIVKHFTGVGGVVKKEVQAAYLQAAIAKYISLLSTIPVNDDGGRSAIDLLDQIGEFLSHEVNGQIFKPEPSLSLKIDNNVPLPVREALGSAMNQGALVMLSDDIDAFDYGAISGARLRLSYLLCPRYHLPLTFGQPLRLSTILGRERGGRIRRHLSMRDLFEMDEDDKS